MIVFVTCSYFILLFPLLPLLGSTFLFLFFNIENCSEFLLTTTWVSFENILCFKNWTKGKTLLVLKIKTREITTLSHSVETFQKELEQKVTHIPRRWTLTADGNKCLILEFWSLIVYFLWKPPVFSQRISARQFITLSTLPPHF